MDELETAKLLYSLQRQGVVLWYAENEKLSYSSNESIPDVVFETIKANKQSIIQFLIERKVCKPYQIPHVFALNLTEYPLSSAQERLWFLAQLQEKDNYIYNEPMALTFDEQCDLVLLKKTIEILIERHACLRTIFKKDMSGSPTQIILPFEDNRVKAVLELNVESIEDQELSIRLDAKLKNVFDLSIELPISCHLYHLKKSNQYVLYVLQHHIITDGTSIGLFISEFYTIYNKLLNNQEIKLAEIDIQYPDYAVWFREYYKKDNLPNQLSYWKNKLEGFQALQIQKDNINVSEYHSSVYKYEIDAKLFDDIKHFSKKNKTTLFVILLSAFYILLNKYSNQNDIVVGTPVNGRNINQIKNVLGFFINTLVLRSKIDNQRICDFLLEVNQLYIEALKYQDLPFEMLVDYMGLSKNQNLSQIFQVFFVYQKFVIPDLKVNDTSWFDNSLSDPATKFDITFDFKETDSKLFASIQYKTNIFFNQTIGRMANHYVNILKQMIQFPECNIADLNVLTEDEYNTIIYQWNNSRLPYSKEKTIVQLFEEQVVKNPDDIAVTYAGSSLTYFELNNAANTLANFIRSRYLEHYKTELPTGTLIVISMESCLELVIAILGVIKTGAAYVPIDVNYPKNHKSFILKDTDAKLIVTKEMYFANIKEIVDDSRIILNIEQGLKPKNLENKNIQNLIYPSDVIYVIYTSGSTGTPKGVCITHLSLNNFVSNVVNKINLTTKKKFLTVTSFTFDVFCFDFFGALCFGGRLILTDSAMVREPDLLAGYIKDNKPDVIIATPSLWHMIVDKLTPSKLTILSAGEALHENLAQKLLGISSDVWDAYGPTEATVLSILKKLSPGEKFSIGKPIPNGTAYVLNQNLKPVPIGVVGELYIGGDCLAKGYLNRPDLTGERFINNPFVSMDEKHEKTNLQIYKTGDLVYWLASGDIKYVGRNDFQIKIAGHRIELGELEFILNQYPNLKQCFVHVAQSETSKQLVVYYTAQACINESDLREYLEKFLPKFMVPHRFIYLEKFPLNNSGKVDIKNLPKLNQVNYKKNIVFPRNSTEEELAKILSRLLKIKSINVNDDIFDIGCDSLTAVQIQTQINSHFHAKIKVADVFYYPTIEKLARHLTNKNIKEEGTFEPINSVKVIKGERIAIIGYSCLFPMSENVEEYWANIKTGRECIRKVSAQECIERGVSADVLNHAKYLPYAGVISDIEMFDAEFWGLSEHDAFFMDPKMRLFLEQTWKALESSGYIKKRKLISTALIACFGKLDYLEKLLQLEPVKNSINYFDSTMSSATDYFLNRIAYLLGISGPLSSVDTTCSSASVAVIEGCEKLLAGKCDLAIVGGVNLCSTTDFGHIYYEGMELLSQDGHSRIFDEKGGGVVRSDGLGVVVLKRLSEAIKDRDHVRSIINGYGISYDGMRKVGSVHPRISYLKECITKAQQNAGSENIDYVECHGMGFKLGEIFEFDAVKETFSNYKSANKCILGSVKANMGHTGYASGLAQLIKVACMLEHRIFPPQINYENPYAEFNLDKEIFQIVKDQQTWQKNQDKPRIAGMTSFGIGGTSAHIILEEAPPVIQPDDKKPTSGFLISLSATSIESLLKMRRNLANYLTSHPELLLQDVAYTLSTREEFKERFAFVCHDVKSCIELLQLNYSDVASINEQSSKWVFNHSNTDMEDPATLSKILYEAELAICKGVGDDMQNLNVIAKCWLQGARINWDNLYSDKAVKLIELPTYSFAKKHIKKSIKKGKHELQLIDV